MESTAFAIAFLSGLIPAIFWLWFWLREDNEQPEPYFLIAIAFIAGMAVVPLVFPLQKLAIEYYQNVELFIVWVIIEELLKYSAALILIFWNREVDQPIDLIIYMIAIALGFAALENALFVFSLLLNGDYFNSAVIGGFRFLGSTLLHVLASGTVGVLMALAFYKSQPIRVLFGSIGLFLAIVLHALFNFSIMETRGGTFLAVFLFVWMGIMILFLLFEKIKLLERAHTH